MLHFVQKPEN